MRWYGSGFAMVLIALTVGCPTGSETPQGRGDVASVQVLPDSPTVEVSPGAPAQVEFTAQITRADGSVEESTEVSWTSSNLNVGEIDGAGQFATTDATGGTTHVRATYLGVWGQTTMTVVYRQEVEAEGAPAGAADLFAGTEVAGSGDEAALLYPLDRVKIPRNTPQITFMWDPGPVCNLFRLRFRSEVTQVDVFTAGTSWVPDEALWHTIAAANAGGTTTLELGCLAYHDDGAGPMVDSDVLVPADPSTIHISRLDAEGSIYYWNASIGGVYRIPFGANQAEEFYGLNNYGHCVSCHVISPDGSRMAVTYDGGNENLGLVSMDAPLDDAQAVIPYSEARHGNFKTFSPDGTRMVSSYWGTLSVTNAENGNHLYDLDLDFLATMPSWSPQGDLMAMVMIDEDSYDPAWVASFHGSRIALLTVDDDGTIGTNPEVIVDAEDGSTVYYPAFSPDGEWIAYNTSWDTDGTYESWNTYDDPSATLRVVSADGTVGFELGAANGVGTLSNSWPGWAPQPDADVLWLTFSSKRPYGYLTSLDDGRPQIWVSAFDLEQATGGGGGDPSSPPFWLPFQDIETNNHIATWGPN